MNPENNPDRPEVWAKQNADPKYDAYIHGRHCAMLDELENAPFSTIGGLAYRFNLQRPGYIQPCNAGEFFRGYADACRKMYGEDWRTCSFSWGPALTIGGAS